MTVNTMLGTTEDTQGFFSLALAVQEMLGVAPSVVGSRSWGLKTRDHVWAYLGTHGYSARRERGLKGCANLFRGDWPRRCEAAGEVGGGGGDYDHDPSHRACAKSIAFREPDMYGAVKGRTFRSPSRSEASRGCTLMPPVARRSCVHISCMGFSHYPDIERSHIPSSLFVVLVAVGVTQVLQVPRETPPPRRDCLRCPYLVSSISSFSTTSPSSLVRFLVRALSIATKSITIILATEVLGFKGHEPLSAEL